MKTIKQEEAIWSSTRSQFLQDEMDFEILISAVFNEQDQDYFNLA
jgi:hypothetical protein